MKNNAKGHIRWPVLFSLALALLSLAPTIFSNPCPGTGFQLGYVNQGHCYDQTGICSLGQWNWYEVRQCEYWCCYEGTPQDPGDFTHYALEDCDTTWVFQECCGDLGYDIDGGPPNCPEFP
jgi:hypothetical protein